MRSKSLICGCCDADFRTWDGYVDQDQDKGYGICKRCQEDIQKRADKETEKSFQLLIGWDAEKIEKTKDWGIEEKRWLVHEAFKDGILSYKIR